MKILVVGSGGREHALAWKLKKSPRVQEIFCAPGNAGLAKIATCVSIPAEDIAGLLNFALSSHIDLTVVGPEAPLTQGIVDAFTAAGLDIFGPLASGAAIEGSKVLAKEIMAKYNIPTASYAVFNEPVKAQKYIRSSSAPWVVKADGLAAGKGVIVCHTEEQALQAVQTIMSDKAFGEAGEQIVIEEYLTGEEVSILAFTDGEEVIPMLAAQDHKPAYDNDTGPNTGGMGAYAPAPVCTPEIFQEVKEKILLPTVHALAGEGRPYRGVLYAGLMITARGPMVLEYNVRFGDPEAQPLLMLLKTDLLDIIEAVLTKRLAQINIQWFDGAAITVVLASGGYPGAYQKEKIITGLEQVPEGIEVFHAGTAFKNGHLVTAGGRVLGVTAAAENIALAISKVYAGIKPIHFEGMHYRRDIGRRAILPKT